MAKDQIQVTIALSDYSKLRAALFRICCGNAPEWEEAALLHDLLKKLDGSRGQLLTGSLLDELGSRSWMLTVTACVFTGVVGAIGEASRNGHGLGSRSWTTAHFVLPVRLGLCESWLSKESDIQAPSLPIVLQPGKGYGRRSIRSHRTLRICRLRFFGWLSLAVSEQSVHLKPLSLMRNLPCHGSGRRSQVVTRPTILRIEPFLGPLHKKRACPAGVWTTKALIDKAR